MKYRIIERRKNDRAFLFIPQYRYSFWPFWFNIGSTTGWCSYESALERLERFKNSKKIKFTKIYHKIGE